MAEAAQTPRLIRFGTYEVDVRSGEVRKGGLKLKLSGQPLQVLAILLERHGEVVTREELQTRLWPDSFVDFDHNLNTAINKIREALSDPRENPRFIETLPRRGYRFIGKVESDQPRTEQNAEVTAETGSRTQLNLKRIATPYWTLAALVAFGVLAVGVLLYERTRTANQSPHRTLTRLTFDDGLQIGATLSPDGRYLAYSSDRGGKYDIWMQQVGAAGNPMQVTRGEGANWEPEWSPDGKYIAYRSEDRDGGLFIVPVLGGAELQRRVASFGHYPHWSPDGSKLVFQTHRFGLSSKIFVVNIGDGNEPREILESVTKRAYVMSTAWHPDGKKVSLWGWDMIPSPIPTFWTGSIDSPGTVIKTELTPEMLKLAKVEAGRGFGAWADSDSKFCWEPSGRSVYFERAFRGARNIWRMKVDAQSLQATGLERLTTGTELASDFALSADGRKLVFTSKAQAVRAWIFPMNSSNRRVMAAGQPVTSTGMEAWEGDLSRNGANLAFSCKRAGRWELCEKTLSGTEGTIASDDSFIRDEPHWSPDGLRLAYVRLKTSTGEVQAVTWDSKTRSENIVTELRHTGMFVFDWSPDGNWLLVSADNPDKGQTEIWKFRAAGVHGPNDAQKVVASEPGCDLFQGRFSPDGRWIAFEGIRRSPRGNESAIYVAPSGGGSWTRITDGKQWQDKPRWSADGRAIFFVSERKGFLNVLSVPFDPVRGKATGEISQVTDFKSADLQIAEVVPSIGFSLAPDKAMLTISQSSGGIWMLDNEDE